MTPVDYLIDQLQAPCKTIPSLVIEKAQQLQKELIVQAIIYALDEDGHTGDWKIKFANDYYNRLTVKS